MAKWISDMLGMVESVGDSRAYEEIEREMALSYLEMILETSN